jgi:hypothetical protein
LEKHAAGQTVFFAYLALTTSTHALAVHHRLFASKTGHRKSLQ